VPIWAGLWVIFGDYVIEGDYVVMMVESEYIFATRRCNVDAAVSFLYYNKCDYSLVLGVLDDPFGEIGVGESFLVRLDHIKIGEPSTTRESGQMKCCINAFEILDTPDANLVVIGGGGPMYTSSGLTYHAIAEEVPSIKMTIYDPVEVPSQVGLVKVCAEYFDYDTDKVDNTVTHVIDDAYRVQALPCQWEEREMVDLIHEGYVGKFVVVVKNNVYALIATPGHHTNHEYTHVMGGGEINKQLTPVLLFGTSGAYGPYDCRVIQRAFPKWYILDSQVFTNCRQYEQLKKIFPKAAITIKALREEYVGAVRRKQHYYVGNEERAYYNATLIPSVGLRCVVCHYVAAVSSRLKIPPERVRKIIVRVGGQDCQPHFHKVKCYADNLINQYARKWAPRKVIIEELVRKLGVTEQSVRSLMALKEQNGTIYFYKSYDGDRCARYKYAPVQSPIMVDQLENICLMMSYLYNFQVIGNYMSGRSDFKLYVGAEYVPYVEVVIPVEMSAVAYHKYETTHEYVEGVVRMFVFKGYFFEKKLMADLYDILVPYKGRAWRFDNGIRLGVSQLNYDGTGHLAVIKNLSRAEKIILKGIPARVAKQCDYQKTLVALVKRLV